MLLEAVEVGSSSLGLSSCSSNLTEHSSYDYMYILETALYTDAVVGTWTAETRSRDTT